MESSLFEKRFVIVAGKGGVGKSTMCAALGLAAARRGKKTIIAELNTREKASQFFGKAPSGYRPQELTQNLYSINIRPAEALHEYGLMKLRLEQVYKLVFENPAMKKLLQMVPGMNETFLLGKVFNMERERDRQGKPLWDMIVVDAPATGHGVSLLRLPQVVLEVVKSGPMADEMRAMRDLLLDRRRTAINVVTLPEEMPVRETIELGRQIDETLRIPKGCLLVNQVWPPLMPAPDRAIFETLVEVRGADDPTLARALSCVKRFARRRELQDRYLRELELRLAMPQIQVPFLFRRDFDAEAVAQVSDHLIKEAERLDLR
jgi:anion-transporting  ArsA/GET3 family ATPase